MTLLEALVAYGVSKGVLVGDGQDSFRDRAHAPDLHRGWHSYGIVPVLA